MNQNNSSDYNRGTISPERRTKLLAKFNDLAKILHISIKNKIAKSNFEIHQKDCNLIKQAEYKIIKGVIKDAENASLVTGYTDFHLNIVKAVKGLFDTYKLELVTQQTCFKNKDVLSNATSAMEAFSVQKAIKILRNGLIRGDYNNVNNK